jgi:hypothetical protein
MIADTSEEAMASIFRLEEYSKQETRIKQVTGRSSARRLVPRKHR